MLHLMHRISASFLGLFILFHLGNHLFILNGIESHIAIMKILRTVYRSTLVECVLIICVLFQVCSGIYFVWKRWGQRVGLLEKSQAASGIYLAFFLINHVGAVLVGRIYLNTDTNIYFGIAGMHDIKLKYFFTPYYFLALVALFVHLSTAMHWLTRKRLALSQRNYLAWFTIILGGLLSLILMLGFYGTFESIEIPKNYQYTD